MSSNLIDHAGSSSYFDRGFVTYSNAAKEEMLGVSRECLDKHGAVSQETAKAMAEGALANSSATLSLSITGIAGPGGGSDDKPVGTVCFAWAQKNSHTRTAMRLFEGDRTTVRRQAACHALKELQKYLDPGA